MDGTTGFRIASFIVYNLIAIPVVFLIGKLIYGLKIKGRSRLRGHRRAMIAANHCQFIEPGFSGVVFWPQKLLFSAEENNVTRKDVGWLTRLLRAFGIPEENPLSIGRFVQKALHNNWFVHFYPEGVISWRSQEPGPFMEGVFLFSVLNDVPVFPLTEVLKDRPIRKVFPKWPPKTVFVIGNPVFPAQFRTPGVSRREQLHRMSAAIRQIIIDTIELERGDRNFPERRQAAPPKPNGS